MNDHMVKGSYPLVIGVSYSKRYTIVRSLPNPSLALESILDFLWEYVDDLDELIVVQDDTMIDRIPLGK